MKRIYWCLVSVVSVAAIALVASAEEQLGAPVTQDLARPNILIIYTDDVGWGDLSCYTPSDQVVVPTPHLDRLAESGIRFTSGYATSATCTPSRYSMMTGRYAFRTKGTGILAGDAPLIIEPGSATLPGQMQKVGYSTGMFGKWHLGVGDGATDWNGAVKPGPLEIGFDRSFIIPATPDRVPCVYLDGHEVAGLNPSVDAPLVVSYRKPVGDLPTGKSHPELLRYGADGQHSGTIINRISRIGFMVGGDSAWFTDETMADRFIDQSLAFIDRAADQKRPFFAVLSLHQVHVPRAPSERFIGQSRAGLYGDTLLELDASVGKVIDHLEARGLRDNTLIIFSADNGPIPYDGYYDGVIEALNGHDVNGPFQGGKYVPFEAGTRLPFLLSWPDRVAPGQVSDAIVSQIDLLHSLSRLVGASEPESGYGDSADLLSAFLGESDRGRDFVVQQALKTLSIRDGDWKYISAGGRAWTLNKHRNPESPTYIPELGSGAYLFNLRDDPGETKNLITESPGVASRLRGLLETVRQRPLAGRHPTGYHRASPAP